MVSIRDTHLYVEDWGPRDAPALLYLHGGPGAGSYDFSFYQRARLSNALRVIVIDQRGVLRSDPLDPSKPFHLNDLVDDCEALRKKLNIARWSLLGHSFGGYLALVYATSCPNAVERVVFENPCFDLGLSARSVLRQTAVEYDSAGRRTEAGEARAAADSTATSAEIWPIFTRLTNALEPAARDRLYFHGSDPNPFSKLVAASSMDKALWDRGATQQRAIYAEGSIFKGVMDRLPRLAQPALLIHSRYDYVTGPDQIAAFEHDVKHGKVLIYDEGGHFSHIEAANAFARDVIAFIGARTGKAAGG